MEGENQKFLETIKAAENLVQTLQELHTETISYKNATKELDAVRQRLINMIEVMQQTAIQSQQALTTLSEIGGPEIIRRLNRIEDIMTQNSTQGSKMLKQVKVLATLAILGATASFLVGLAILLIR